MEPACDAGRVNGERLTDRAVTAIRVGMAKPQATRAARRGSFAAVDGGRPSGAGPADPHFSPAPSPAWLAQHGLPTQRTSDVKILAQTFGELDRAEHHAVGR